MGETLSERSGSGEQGSPDLLWRSAALLLAHAEVHVGATDGDRQLDDVLKYGGGYPAVGETDDSDEASDDPTPYSCYVTFLPDRTLLVLAGRQGWKSFYAGLLPDDPQVRPKKLRYRLDDATAKPELVTDDPVFVRQWLQEQLEFLWEALESDPNVLKEMTGVVGRPFFRWVRAG